MLLLSPPPPSLPCSLAAARGPILSLLLTALVADNYRLQLALRSVPFYYEYLANPLISAPPGLRPVCMKDPQNVECDFAGHQHLP